MGKSAKGRKGPKQPSSKSSNSSKPSNPSEPSKPSRLPSINVDFSLLRINKVIYENKGELDKKQVEELVRNCFKTNNQKTIDDLTFRLNRLEKNERHLLRQELSPRVSKMEEQLRLGVSEKQIIEAHAQGANENMKGVITGAACAVLVGLLVVAALSYASKDSSKRTAAETNNGEDFDDDWRDAAKGSSVEQLEFAMAKLRKMNV